MTRNSAAIAEKRQRLQGFRERMIPLHKPKSGKKRARQKNKAGRSGEWKEEVKDWEEAENCRNSGRGGGRSGCCGKFGQ